MLTRTLLAVLLLTTLTSMLKNVQSPVTKLTSSSQETLSAIGSSQFTVSIYLFKFTVEFRANPAFDMQTTARPPQQR